MAAGGHEGARPAELRGTAYYSAAAMACMRHLQARMRAVVWGGGCDGGGRADQPHSCAITAGRSSAHVHPDTSSKSFATRRGCLISGQPQGALPERAKACLLREAASCGLVVAGPPQATCCWMQASPGAGRSVCLSGLGTQQRGVGGTLKQLLSAQLQSRLCAKSAQMSSTASMPQANRTKLSLMPS